MALNFDKSNPLRLRAILKFLLILLLIAPYFLVNVHANVHANPVLEDPTLSAKIVTQGLTSPTSMAFLNRNEILVLEKDEGKVLRIIDGSISKDPVLTLDVNHHKERGLLGIVLPNNIGGDEGDKESVHKYVYLFYTEPRYSGKGTEICKKQQCEEEQFNNRLYRYEYKNNKLVNSKLLVDIPIYWNNRVYPSLYSEIIHGGHNWSSYPIREGVHQGGSLVMDNDNNIYLITGDGGACHTPDGCYRSVNNGYLSTQTANKKDGNLPIGMGGILRVTDNGKPVNDKGIVGDGNPLNYYYAYGIRNSFGMDFDPVTGKLWDTENGPHYGDEINLVEPGFNSGWAKIQGIWPLANYTELQDNATTKGYTSTSPPLAHNDLEDFGGKGLYSDPEFTWNASVGVTSIKFLNTDKLGKQYENDVLVGDALGRIYHFDLNKNRTQLDLNGTLQDKVANSESELQDAIFGQGFNTVTDMEVGPDGYLYLLSYSGIIYKISPKVVND